MPLPALLAALESLDSAQALQTATQLTAYALDRAELALCAWAWQRWSFDLAIRPGARFQQFQVNRERWRAADNWAVAPAIRDALDVVLRQQLPEQYAVLKAAAGIFNGIFSVEVYVGNADTGGYTIDCQQQWEVFAPFREWFAAALPLAASLQREWATLAQVYWAHFRWQADDGFYGTFSVLACGYLLAQAVVLDVPSPIHYYYLYRELPTPYATEEPARAGQELALQSNRGLTYFYYAQYCQYHGADAAQALTYYQRFIADEPACQPDNQFSLFCRDATTRSYPPSVQTAQAAMGTIYQQQGQLPAARAAFERAIAAAPANFQAPYAAVATLLRQQHELAAALPWLARQADVCTQAALTGYGRLPPGLGSIFTYDPSCPGPLDLSHFPGGSGWWDAAARVRVQEVNEWYRELANAYFYELADYPQAGVYYKKYLTGLARQRPGPQQMARTVAATESQLRLAVEQGDHWQARSLGEKLLRLAPDNPVAPLYLERIRQRFA